jgi:hypothetical protein
VRSPRENGRQGSGPRSTDPFVPGGPPAHEIGLWPPVVRRGAGRERHGRYPDMGNGEGKRCPDATQPRVTVRPKPPVLLGAASTMTRWQQAVVVSDNPRPYRPRRLQGSRRDAPRTIFVRSFQPTPVTLPLRGSLPSLDPTLRCSLGFPLFRLAASLWASLASTLRRSLEVRRAFVSELETDCASRHARSMDIREIQTFSPSFFRSSPSVGVAVPSSSPC